MGFGDWLRSTRQEHESGQIDSETYASRLEKKAKEVPDEGHKDFLQSRARFIRDDADNKNAKAEEERKHNGLW